MSETLPVVYLARHGETAWTLSGQHTGLTDLPLTDQGKRNARQLGHELRGRQFARIFTSPLQRAARTCELAGFGAQSEVDRDLVEWNYGEYEGLRTVEIYSGMVTLEGNRPPRLGHAQIAWLNVCARSSEMF
jgi:broad specificity phosphatase PhoE